MPVTLLKLTNFRHFEVAEFAPNATGFTCLIGSNGSGKTSLLEAIHCLSVGRSFRTAQHTPLIKQGEKEFVLFAELHDQRQLVSSIGMSRHRSGDIALHLNSELITSCATLAPLLPVRVIHSQSHHLFEMGPTFRRKYLDWGLFYQFPEFIRCWRAYEQTLKQRNQLLRDQKGYSSDMQPWTTALIQYAEELDVLRRQYVAEFLPHFHSTIAELLPDIQFECEYLPGWSKSQSFEQALKASLHDECRAGYTVIGPHRADLELSVNGVAIKQFLSRGQQKLLICAMIIAQGNLCFQTVGKQIVYLVDDLPSELDLDSAKRLLILLSQQGAQVFVSAITSDVILETMKACSVPLKVFHVKHNGIEEQSV